MMNSRNMTEAQSPRIRSVKFNAVMNFILTGSNFIFPLITFPYVTRTLQAVGNGRIAFASSVVQYFVMFAALGIPTYGIRACARVRDDKMKLSRTAQELFIINLITSAIAYVAFFFSVYYVAALHVESTLMYINSLYIILNTIGIDWLYQAMEQYAYITARNIGFKLISILLMFIFVHTVTDVYAYATISIFAAVGSNTLNLFNAHHLITFKFERPLHFRQHIKPIFIFFSLAIASSIYGQLATVMLGLISTKLQVGLLDAASKLKSMLTSAVTSLGNVMLPRLSYHYQHGNKDEFYRLISKTLNFVLLASSPIVLFLIIYAEPAIRFVCGNGYLAAVPAMQAIMLTVLFAGLSGTTGLQMLVPMGKENIVLLSTVLGAVTDCILNLLTMRSLGAMGAAANLSIAEFIVLVVQLIYLHKEMKVLLHFLSFLPCIAALIPAGAVSWLILASLNTNSFIQLLVGGVTFMTLYYCILLLLKVPLAWEAVHSVKDKLHLKIITKNNKE